MVDVNIHKVVKIEYRMVELEHYSKPFWVKHIVVTTEKGEKVDISLFSDVKKSLKF